MKRAEGTIRQRLFAIKMGHVVAGYEDPTLHRTRLWAALAGYKRWQPDTKRKYPVLPSMLRWIHRHLQGGEHNPKDACVVWAAIMVAFFYLLRASEYLVQQNRSWSERRVLKGKDVEGRRDNKACANVSEAEELVIYLTGSKTGQYNQGTVRNHFKSGDPVLCPVLAVAAMQRAFPHRFQGAFQVLGRYPGAERRHPRTDPTSGHSRRPRQFKVRISQLAHRRRHGNLICRPRTWTM